MQCNLLLSRIIKINVSRKKINFNIPTEKKILFVGLFCSTPELFTDMETYLISVKGCKYSALTPIEQREFINVSHLLYNR